MHAPGGPLAGKPGLYIGVPSSARDPARLRVEGRQGHRVAAGAPDLFRPACRGPLQVRLEIAIVTDFLVHLQPIPLTVGNHDVIRLRIEIHSGREAEAPLWL